MKGWLNHKDVNTKYWKIERSTENNLRVATINHPTRWEFAESALFWLRDDGRPGWEQLLYPIETKLLSDDTILDNRHWHEVYLWIEYYPNLVWPDAPGENHRWRLRYNNGSNSYMEKYYDDESTTLQEFEYLTLTNTYTELFTTFKELNFQY